MSYHTRAHDREAARRLFSLPKKGTAMVLKGVPSPVVVVSRHTQYDNGEVEVVYVLGTGEIKKAWLPAEILAAHRVPFRRR